MRITILVFAMVLVANHAVGATALQNVQAAAVNQNVDQVLPNLNTLSGTLNITYSADAGTYESCTFSFSQNASTLQVDPTIPSTPSQYQTKVAPSNVIVSGIDASKLYTVLMLDAGVGPTFASSNFVAGFVHWTQINVPGSELLTGVSGSSMGGEAFNEYFGPTNPQLASHMYTLGVYEQKGTITPTLAQYEEYSNGTSAAGPARANWNTAKFVSDFSLGSVKAASWMRITFDSYTPYRIVTTGIGNLVGGDNCYKLVQQAAVSQGAIDAIPNATKLSKSMTVVFTSKLKTSYSSCGLDFDQSGGVTTLDPLGPTHPGQWQTTEAPRVTVSGAESSKLYTLIMYTAGAGPPFAENPPYVAGYVSWTVMNINGTDLAQGQIGASATTQNPYFGPAAPKFPAQDMYAIAVYEQPYLSSAGSARITPSSSQSQRFFRPGEPTSGSNNYHRLHWPTGEFVSTFGLGDAVAVSWFRVGFDSFTPNRTAETGLSVICHDCCETLKTATPRRAALDGRWHSAGCEVQYPLAADGTPDKWWKRAFEFDAHRMVWSGNFSFYTDSACTKPAGFPLYQVVQQPMALENASSHIGYTQDAQFTPEEDIALRTGDLLFIGARPPDGGGLTKRPRAFSPALQRASGAQGPPPTTLASVAGYWQSPVCEVREGSSAGYQKRTIQITAGGTWSAIFQGYSDPSCDTKDAFLLEIAQQRVEVTSSSSKVVAYAAEVTFDRTAAVKEYDVMLLSGGMLFLGARPPDGSLINSQNLRPLNLGPPLISVPPTVMPQPTTTTTAAPGQQPSGARQELSFDTTLTGFTAATFTDTVKQAIKQSVVDALPSGAATADDVRLLNVTFGTGRRSLRRTPGRRLAASHVSFTTSVSVVESLAAQAVAQVNSPGFGAAVQQNYIRIDGGDVPPGFGVVTGKATLGTPEVSGSRGSNTNLILGLCLGLGLGIPAVAALVFVSRRRGRPGAQSSYAKTRSDTVTTTTPTPTSTDGSSSRSGSRQSFEMTNVGIDDVKAPLTDGSSGSRQSFEATNAGIDDVKAPLTDGSSGSRQSFEATNADIDDVKASQARDGESKPGTDDRDDDGGDGSSAAREERSTTEYSAEQRKLGSGEGLVSKRIEVQGKGSGTVVEIRKAKGKSTEHVIDFDNGVRESVLLRKHLSTDGTQDEKGHKFWLLTSETAADPL